MMEMRGSKKSVVCLSLMVLISVALMATAAAGTVDFGKNIQLFALNGGTSTAPQGNSGTADTAKAASEYAHPEFYTSIKPPSSNVIFYKPSSTSFFSSYVYQTNLPVYYPPITPVPQQQPAGVTSVSGSSNSTLGGLIIRGAEEGDWISLRSNFYDPIDPLCNGRWHYDIGTTPAYWENKVPPGSYTIKVAYEESDKVYYCDTVTVIAGQTTVVDAGLGLCPFCSSC